MITEISSQDVTAIEKLDAARRKIMDQLGQVIVGQTAVIEELLICLFSRGHCLLEGVPGLAKTLMISTLSRTLNLSFSRIQFTPDLTPADITGTDVIVENRSTGAREFRFLEGPLFANVVLADEVNRTPPKTQAALLEAMQERQVTVGRVRHALADPFFILATQNPIEQEGTYPLPEAQQDRFMFKVFVRYPNFQEEFEVARRTTTTISDCIEPVLTAREILDLQRVGPRGAGFGPRNPLRLGAGAADPRPRGGRARLRRRPGYLGRGAARGAVSDPRRQGPRAPAGRHARDLRRHRAAGQARAAAPHGPELHRRERGRDHRPGHRAHRVRNTQARRRADPRCAIPKDFCVLRRPGAGRVLLS